MMKQQLQTLLFIHFIVVGRESVQRETTTAENNRARSSVMVHGCLKISSLLLSFPFLSFSVQEENQDSRLHLLISFFRSCLGSFRY